MYIYEVIIDGFKSYAQRTVVGPFDSHFNAITGLNGSGKSNILDSICFVLGITAWGQLRASSLQDLIYKQGTAGVEKASVSIVFDNKDPGRSPTGYEKEETITVTRQIVMGGRNKYLINGKTVQQTAVHNLFQSVQLNISNPHFLIMQGHIAKVLNMKPKETLSMLEEASGTRMFEAKKDSALKTIAQKDGKLEDINKILAESITPKLDKLRAERSAYKEYLALKTKMEEDAKFCAAYEYALAKREVEAADDHEVMFRIQELEAQLKEKEAIFADIEHQITEARHKQDDKGVFADLEKQVTQLEKDLLAIGGKKQRQASEEKSELKNVKKLEEQRGELESLLTTKQVELDATIANEDACLRAKNAAEAALSTLQHGFSSAETSVEGQLIAARQTISEQQTRLEKLTRQYDQAAQDLKTAKGRLANVGKNGDYTKLEAAKLKAQQTVDKLETELKKMLTPEDQENEIMAAHPEEYQRSQVTIQHTKNAPAGGKAKATGGRRGKKDTQPAEDDMDVDGVGAAVSVEARSFIDKLEARQAHLNAFAAQLRHTIRQVQEDGLSDAMALESTKFKASFPKGVDPSEVLGRVCTLVKVKDQKTAAALTLAGGSRWHGVVIRSAKTATAFLQSNMASRTIFVPLDRIAAKAYDKKLVDAAQKTFGAENISSAQQLLEYPAELQRVMDYVVGNTLIAADNSVADKATSPKHGFPRTVSHSGNIYDNNANVTGGSEANPRAPILEVMFRHQERETVMAQLNGRLEFIEGLERTMQQMQDELGRASQELSMLTQKLEVHPFHEQTAQVKKFEELTKNLKEVLIPQVEVEIKESTELTKGLERQLEGKTSAKESKAAKSAQEKTTKDAQQALRTAKDRRVQVESELAEAKNELADLRKELLTKQASLEALTLAVSQLEDEASSLTILLNQAKAALSREKGTLEEHERTIKSLGKKKDQVRKQITDAKMEQHKYQVGMEEAKAQSKKSKARMEELIRHHPGIDRDHYAHGRHGSADAATLVGEVDRVRSTLAANRKKIEKLERSINTKASAMLDSSEREYDDLQTKKKQIESDRSSIMNAIAEFEAKKMDTLQRTFEQVSVDFATIFSTLLPGAKAKLITVEDGPITDGLVVKVDLNNNWNTSLSELSGGQRSLLALSLVLALLRFNPAPMYILDEIDAALDLSHTQNIGTMLKTHSSQSQFIIVSLKEGMFNNANVLFKTSLDKGISKVDRYAHSREAASSSATTRRK